jgi:tripartite-type tricarboxylate transporter receptor subunit TctC
MRLLHILACIAAVLVIAAPATAQSDFPNKPIVIVVPTTPGGAADTMTRLIAQKLSESMKVPVVVDNKPGAGNVIGSTVVAKAVPNGYTLLMTYTDHVFNPFLRPSMPYDSVKDFAPVVEIGSVPMLLVSNPSVPVKSVHDLIALAKAKPQRLHFASAGNGSSLHLAGELFNSMANVELVHVPYKGTSPAFVDLLGGEVELMFPTIASSLSYVQSGKVRALAVTSARRVSNLPDIPTVAEAGLPGYEASIWYAVLTRAGTPKDVVTRLNAEFRKALAAPDVAAKLAEQGFVISPGTPEDLEAKILREMDRWGKVIKQAKITLD